MAQYFIAALVRGGTLTTWPRACRIALPAVLLGVVALATGCGREKLSPHDVKLAAASVQSNSAEAALTARCSGRQAQRARPGG